jgi:hypothetical protein
LESTSINFIFFHTYYLFNQFIKNSQENFCKRKCYIPTVKDRIVNIDKEKYEINSLHVYSCYDITCKEIFVVRLSKNQYKSTVYTHNSYNNIT